MDQRLPASDVEELGTGDTPAGGRFVERLAQRFGASARAGAVFGEPVERQGVTIVPVATVRYGVGGGGGAREHEVGSGGGGGVMAAPVGYIEMKDGQTRFHAIRRPQDWLGLGLIAGLCGTILLAQYMRHEHRVKLMHQRGELPM